MPKFQDFRQANNNEKINSSEKKAEIDVLAKLSELKKAKNILDQNSKPSEELGEVARNVDRALDILENYDKLPNQIQGKLLEGIRQTTQYEASKTSGKIKIKGPADNILDAYDKLFTGVKVVNKKFGLRSKDNLALIKIYNNLYEKLDAKSDENLYANYDTFLEISDTLLNQYDKHESGTVKLNLRDIEEKRTNILNDLKKRREEKINQHTIDLNKIRKAYEEKEETDPEILTHKASELIDEIDDSIFNLANISKYRNQEIKADLTNQRKKERLKEDGAQWSKLNNIKANCLVLLKAIEDGTPVEPGKKFTKVKNIK